VNRRRAQLLIACHDVTTLGASFGTPLLDRDQIWFTEKDQAGATVLYPLAEFGPCKGENLERGYLAGRYGATPGLARGSWGGCSERSRPMSLRNDAPSSTTARGLRVRRTADSVATEEASHAEQTPRSTCSKSELCSHTPKPGPLSGVNQASSHRATFGIRIRPRRHRSRRHYGWRKILCVPTRRQTTCDTPGRRSGSYSKVARPSGAHVISHTPGQPWTPFTRSPGWNARPAFKPATIAMTAVRKRRCC